MKIDFLPWAVAPALVAPLLLNEDPQARTGLTPVTPQVAESTDEVAAWKNRLQDGDLAAREAAFDDFVAAVRRDDGLRRAAREWRDGSDASLAWTARLALREAGDARPGALRRAPLGGNGPWRDELRERLDEMQRQFGDMDQMFEDLQRQFQHGNVAPQGRGGFGPGRGFARSENYSMQVTPDGVKVQIDEDVDGQVEKKTYEAKTLDELYEAHPELKDKLGARVQIDAAPRVFGWSQDGNDDFMGLRPMPRDDVHRGLVQGEFRTDRLGVMIDTRFDEASRTALGLDAGVGLKVASVLPNTIASKIGVVEGDVVVELNGRALKSADDVRAVLEARPQGEDVNVTVIDAQKKRRTLTWRAPTEPLRKL